MVCYVFLAKCRILYFWFYRMCQYVIPFRMSFISYLIALCSMVFSMVLPAKEPWPGEAWTESTILTALDDDFQNNLSGVHWNPYARTLWLTLNGPAKVWALKEGSDGHFVIDYKKGVRGEMNVSGDIEGITQVDYTQQQVFVLDESDETINQYDVSDYKQAKLLNQWDLGKHLPSYFGSGPEGIAFVPDIFLSKQNFQDQSGQPYTSQYGMGGLMFVAHQNGGHIYAFDLDPKGHIYRFVGKYTSARDESSGLEFDRSSGLLFIWHNTDGNSLELTTLASSEVEEGERKLNQIKEYSGPKGGNLEGFALTPAKENEYRAILVDDDNQDGAALMLFNAFSPNILVEDKITTQ